MCVCVGGCFSDGGAAACTMTHLASRASMQHCAESVSNYTRKEKRETAAIWKHTRARAQAHTHTHQHTHPHTNTHPQPHTAVGSVFEAILLVDLACGLTLD